MKMRRLLFESKNGVTDMATLEVKKERLGYSGYITIGTVQRKVFLGFTNENDVHLALTQVLGMYKEDVLEKKEREMGMKRAAEGIMKGALMGITTITNPEVQGLVERVRDSGVNIDYREYIGDVGIDKGTILYGYVLGEDGAYTQDPEEELCCIVQKGEMWITKSSVVVKCRMHGTCLGDLDNRDEGGCFTYAPRPEDRNRNG